MEKPVSLDELSASTGKNTCGNFVPEAKTLKRRRV